MSTSTIRPAPRWTSVVPGSRRGSPPRAGDHADLLGRQRIAAAVILGAQAVVFAIGAARAPRHPYGRCSAPRPPRLGPGHRARTGAAVEVRPTRRLRVRRRRRHRLRRGVLLLGLDATASRWWRRSSMRPSASAWAASSIRSSHGFAVRLPPHNPQTPSNRKDFVHGTLRRPGHTDWAESNLDAPNTVFVEVDEDTSAYDGGHIAGAVKLDWRADLQDPVVRDFVDAEQFSKLLSERGISNDDTVILYGGNNNWFAAYAYWYFKLYGHDKVKLLDGGRKKWELDGRPLSTEAVNRPATSYTAKVPITPSARSATRSSRHRQEEPRRRALPRRVLRQDPGARAPAAGAEPAPGISPVRSTFRGARRPTRTARSSPTRTWPSCTPRPAWTARRRPSRTAGSVSARRTPGSCCGAAGTQERQELRRKLDGIRLPGGSPDRVGKLICALHRSKD